jgi:YVTN family beta-propeller protein
VGTSARKARRPSFGAFLALAVLVATGVALWRTGALGSGNAAPRGRTDLPGAAARSVGAPLADSRPTPPPARASTSRPSPGPNRLAPPAWKGNLTLAKTIGGDITPKSVDASGTGLFFAQNMIYQHSVTVYDESFRLVKTIPDTVDLRRFGYRRYPAGPVHGGPVEAAFTPDRSEVYVSNYSMYGPGFSHPGHDACTPSEGIDASFVYRINTSTLRIDQVIAVGAVPKFLAVTPDGRLLLVSDWCSYSLSVVSTNTGKEIKRISVGPYPRGIAVTADSKTAYVAMMGTSDIAKVNLSTFGLRWIRGVGSGPRHLVLDPGGRYLYVTLNEGSVAKIDVRTERVVGRVVTGARARSMAISTDGTALFVVNYDSGTMTKVRAADLRVLQTVRTSYHPIGITYDSLSGNVWVSCYGGAIMVFRNA